MFGQERDTIEEAFPGDVVGLVNATDVRVGDTLYAGPKVVSTHPELLPRVLLRRLAALDPGRFKQFQPRHRTARRGGRGAGTSQPDIREKPPVLAAVGQLQFEVVANRLEHEFGAKVELSPSRFTLARRTDEASRADLASMSGVEVMRRSDGSLLALFESKYWLNHLLANNPDLTFEPLVAGALADMKG